MQESTVALFNRRNAWKQFKKNRVATFSLYVLAFFAFIALLAPLIANERPLYMKYLGENFYPAFSFQKKYQLKNANGNGENMQLDITDWKHLPVQKVIWTAIPYSPNKSDYVNANYVSPFGKQLFQNKDGQLVSMPHRFRHWLGTGQRGEDLLSGLIHGARISMTIGFISMGIAALIGILMGAFSGFFRDDKLNTSRGVCVMIVAGLILGWFYGFRLRNYALSAGLQDESGGLLLQLTISIVIFISVVFISGVIGKYVAAIFPFLRRQIHVPVDSIISRLIEILVSLPLFLVIIAIAAISKPSIVNLMVIIGFTNWTVIARLTRAEMLRVSQSEYIQAAEALGFSKRRIIFRHALPNALAPAVIAVSFGIANAILIESALSFIGLGVPQDIVTWGALLSAGTGNFDAWWMVIFPGLCIFLTVTSYNLIGEGLRDALDPRIKL
jgi:peptide/nickel transport system permease protein